ncbi:MAG: cupin domain-containing protein [Planctomycetota bacterium]
MQYIFSTTKTKRYRFPTHINDLVMDRSKAKTSEVFVVVLAPGEAPPMHQHDDTEQIFYILKGHGRLEIGGEKQQFAVASGNVVRIPPCKPHRIFCEGRRPLVYLAIDCFLNGRPKAEPTWDIHVKSNCRKFGWSFKEVVGAKKTQAT